MTQCLPPELRIFLLKEGLHGPTYHKILLDTPELQEIHKDMKQRSDDGNKKFMTLLESAVKHIGTRIIYPIHLSVWEWPVNLQPDVVRIGYRSSPYIYAEETSDHLMILKYLQENIKLVQNVYKNYLNDYKKTPEGLQDAKCVKEWERTRDTSEESSSGFIICEWPQTVLCSKSYVSSIPFEVKEALLGLGNEIDGVFYPED
jgi:hypothetical protein